MKINKFFQISGLALICMASFFLQGPKVQDLVFGAGLIGMGGGILAENTKEISFDRIKLIPDKNWLKGAMGMLVLCTGISILATRIMQPETNETGGTNYCDFFPEQCVGNLDIPRSEMPQLEGEVKENFLMSNLYTCEYISPTNLAPIQNEANYEKILGMIDSALKGIWDPCLNPILTTKDDHVLDGHHRFFACSYLNQTISTFKLQFLSAWEAIAKANIFPGVEHHALNEFNN
ncbi:MAG: hypothetical protein K940chlam6_00810 [Chlamydiae bacterium]|nr:hypothetical protein [Chlamydiota bacterium]